MPMKYSKLFTLFKEKQISTYYLRVNKIIGSETLKKLKSNTGNIDTRTIEKLCKLLDCQPADIMEYIPD